VRRSSEDATRRECNAVGATRRMQRGGCNAAECNAIGRRRASFVATHSPAGDRVPAANPGAPRDRAPRVASAPGSLPGARSGTDQCRQSHGHGRVVPHEVDAGMGDAQRQHGHGERATAAPTALLQPGERPDKDPEKQAKPDQTDLRTDLKRCVMGPAGIPVAASSSTIGSGSRGGQPADQPCPPDERHKQPDADHLAPRPGARVCVWGCARTALPSRSLPWFPVLANGTGGPSRCPYHHSWSQPAPPN
jgi:hypothetical protein